MMYTHQNRFTPDQNGLATNYAKNEATLTKAWSQDTLCLEPHSRECSMNNKQGQTKSARYGDGATKNRALHANGAKNSIAYYDYALEAFMNGLRPRMRENSDTCFSNDSWAREMVRLICFLDDYSRNLDMDWIPDRSKATSRTPTKADLWLWRFYFLFKAVQHLPEEIQSTKQIEIFRRIGEEKKWAIGDDLLRFCRANNRKCPGLKNEMGIFFNIIQKLTQEFAAPKNRKKISDQRRQFEQQTMDFQRYANRIINAHTEVAVLDLTLCDGGRNRCDFNEIQKMLDLFLSEIRPHRKTKFRSLIGRISSIAYNMEIGFHLRLLLFFKPEDLNFDHNKEIIKIFQRRARTVGENRNLQAEVPVLREITVRKISKNQASAAVTFFRTVG